MLKNQMVLIQSRTEFHIVNRLDIVSYKSVYSLRIIIKPATLKASFSTLLFPAAIEQRQYNFTCLHFLGWCHLFDVFVLFVVTPVIFALSSLIVVYDFSLLFVVNAILFEPSLSIVKGGFVSPNGIFDPRASRRQHLQLP